MMPRWENTSSESVALTLVFLDQDRVVPPLCPTTDEMSTPFAAFPDEITMIMERGIQNIIDESRSKHSNKNSSSSFSKNNVRKNNTQLSIDLSFAEVHEAVISNNIPMMSKAKSVTLNQSEVWRVRILSLDCIRMLMDKIQVSSFVQCEGDIVRYPHNFNLSFIYFFFF